MANTVRRHSASFTEDVWKTGTDLDVLIDGLGALIRDGWSHLTRRRFRLFGVALARCVEHLLPDDEWRQAIQIAERAADGLASEEEVHTARYNLSFRHADPSGPPFTAEWNGGCAEIVVQFSLSATDRYPVRIDEVKWAASWAVNALLDYRLLNAPNNSPRVEYAKRAFQREQLRVLHDIFGDPFHKVKFDTCWRTEPAVSLGRQMYDSREFSAMPILADTLLDAGCDNYTIINHCRDTAQVHVRGCWVVDLVLGKT